MNTGQLPAHIVRLLRSTQVALPMTSNFWGDLARGLATKPDDLASDIKALYESGAIEGIWGEPNPAHENSGESITTGNSVAKTSITRWQSSAQPAMQSLWQRQGTIEGWKSIRWFKVSTLPDWSSESDEQFLAHSTDRTTIVRDDELERAQALSPEQKRVLALFDQPIKINPPLTPWAWIERNAGLPEEEARKAIASLVISRHWRRFAFKLNLTACGWRGCGLAGWQIEKEHIPAAAQALASIRATGDVVLRAEPYVLTALILAREPGQGERIARRISEQWSRPLERFIPLQI